MIEYIHGDTGQACQAVGTAGGSECVACEMRRKSESFLTGSRSGPFAAGGAAVAMDARRRHWAPHKLDRPFYVLNQCSSLEPGASGCKHAPSTVKHVHVTTGVEQPIRTYETFPTCSEAQPGSRS